MPPPSPARLLRRALLGLLLAAGRRASAGELGQAVLTAAGEAEAEATASGGDANAAATALLGRNASSSSAAADPADRGQAIIDWVRANGGFVHAALRVGRIGPGMAPNGSAADGAGADDLLSNTPFALFATEPIPVGETILVIPYNLTINAEGSFDECDTARNLHRELRRGADSQYAPYVLYLLETQTPGQTPAQWSAPGRALLQKMLRHDDTSPDDESYLTRRALPPYDVASWSYLDRCRPAPEEAFAFEMLRYRGWDDVMIPVYDMTSHSNHPDLFNTKTTKIMNNFEAAPIVITTTRPVPAGGQIYCSYNVYKDSDNLFDFYGTPAILADFGFVESHPQRWIFDEYGYYYLGANDEEEEEDDDDAERAYPRRSPRDVNVAFDLEPRIDGTVDVVWVRGTMTEEAVEFVWDAIQHLTAFGAAHLRDRPAEVPEPEWNIVVEYHRAMRTALEQALYAHFYDPMRFGHDDKNAIDEATYAVERHYTCNHWESHAFTGHDTLESITSHYQRLEFDMHPTTKETCFSLDMYVQQCTSYRPHYHEVAIHYTARYLEQVRRIAWIGGGDSMLLHDALKYPTLELALGLELDQMVTRYNYKYMGAQPHFDNEKVQWWYGDATKSLLMLPQEYFGSFDMVVIDLSDTAMQLSVTSDLSIFAALSLLLRPGGIMVKNEEYMEQFSRVFDYTVQSHFYDVPVVCSQSFILGSYENDFLTVEPKDHQPSDLVFVNRRPDIQSKYGIWHDYRHNVTRTNAHCRDGATASASIVPSEQNTSPGILLVVEAEKLKADLSNIIEVKESLVDALKTAQVSLVDAFVSAESGMVGLVMSTGYVVARLFPEHNYCAFDIHFWGSFELQEVVKSALVTAVGGGLEPKATSSYRVVAGGMFGVDTWKEDAKRQGPRKLHECKDSPTSSRGTFSDDKALDQITDRFLSLVGSDSDAATIDVLVVCGGKKDDCNSFKSVKKSSRTNRVLEIRSCEDTEGFKQMQLCEKETLNVLEKFAADTKSFNGFDALILDPDAPLEILQIIYDLFKSNLISKLFKNQEFIMVANSKDTRSTLRRAFLDKFRQETTDPAYRAQVFFNSTHSSLEAGLFLYGVPDPIERLKAVVHQLERETGLVGEVRAVAGGLFRHQHNFSPEFVYRHEDFDVRDALEQWESQQPVGLQTIFQFVQLGPEELFDMQDAVLVFYPDDGDWYPAKVVAVHPADDTVDVRYDSGAIGRSVSTSLVRKDENNVAPAQKASGKDEVNLSAEGIKAALEHALAATKLDGMERATVQHYTGPGEGSLTVACWPGGNAVALWDGRGHLDLNLFTVAERPDAATALQERLKRRLPAAVKTALRDEQPRGHGRVVSYRRDLAAYEGRPPVWAEHLAGK